MLYHILCVYTNRWGNVKLFIDIAKLKRQAEFRDLQSVGGMNINSACNLNSFTSLLSVCVFIACTVRACMHAGFRSYIYLRGWRSHAQF